MNRNLILGGSALLLMRLVLFCFSYNDYGYFLDEYYYLSCAYHPALGYVDHPPLSIWLLRMQVELFGESLLSIRIIPFLAAELSIVLAGMIAHRLGGRTGSILLSMLSVALCPVILGLTKFYSMNSLDLVLWGASIYLFLVCLEKPELKNWALLGLVMGLGLLNKYSILMLGAGFFAGLVISRHRTLLKRAGPYVSGLLSLVLFLPYVYWQVSQGWPSLEFMENASLHKNFFEPVAFLTGLILEWNPILFPLWLAGFASLFFFQSITEKRNLWQPLGPVVLTAMAIVMTGKGKSYYIAPLVLILLPAGAIAISQGIRRGILRSSITGPFFFAAVFLSGMLLAPLSMPLLTAENYIKYEAFLGLQPPKMEKHNRGTMPQHFAGMFGWQELQQSVMEIYNALPQSERKHTVIVARNYGLAGALEFHSRRNNLPAVGSGHNNFYLWGLPESESGDAEFFLFVGFDARELEPYFKEIQEIQTIHCSACMEYRRNTEVIRASHPVQDPQIIWKRLKFYI
ncbi:MAG TPA: hypothetical protein DEA96_04455 [Leptospiraceae bacterium]|nr:hypothetical protein [Spirochaetaceae bacterium]HBS04193.1 hypothetical protein [Leptospiraceae bacterium]|tara:strand:- start:32552 stop:34093 length:1542 start_codon:yes stop_codon:yes gene_type:complete